MSKMEFMVNDTLLTEACSALSKRTQLYWIVGGAGSGKTTVSQALSTKFEIPIYDMDEHIYGAYHHRFTYERHPMNKAWSTSENSLAWLLEMTWEEFNHFNQAALPEYVDLLVEDIQGMEPNGSLIIDGGISNPTLVAQVLPRNQIVCLAMPEQTSADVWEANEERRAMKALIYALPEREKAWLKFLEFDRWITQTILEESRGNDLAVCSRKKQESVDEFSARVAQVLGL